MNLSLKLQEAASDLRLGKMGKIAAAEVMESVALAMNAQSARPEVGEIQRAGAVLDAKDAGWNEAIEECAKLCGDVAKYSDFENQASVARRCAESILVLRRP